MHAHGSAQRRQRNMTTFPSPRQLRYEQCDSLEGCMSKVVRGGSKSVTHTLEISACVCVCVCVCVRSQSQRQWCILKRLWEDPMLMLCWFFFFGKSREKKKKGANQRKGSGCFASNRRVKVNDYANQPQWLKLALCVGIHYRGKHHWFNNIYILHKSWWLITADGRVPTVH